jgi:hypothetical protein
MNEDHRELLEGLRALAADGPRDAPSRVEDLLKMAFQKQNRRRNLVRWVPSISAAAAAGIALLLWSHRATPKASAAPTVAVVQATPVAEEEPDADFYPLPEAEGLPAVENTMVVRVRLPASSLRLMGVPVGEERADDAVQADLLLGQDGLARAVRLAQ